MPSVSVTPSAPSATEKPRGLSVESAVSSVSLAPGASLADVQALKDMGDEAVEVTWTVSIRLKDQAVRVPAKLAHLHRAQA